MDAEIDWQRELDSSFGTGRDVPAGHYVAAGHRAVRRRRQLAAQRSACGHPTASQRERRRDLVDEARPSSRHALAQGRATRAGPARGAGDPAGRRRPRAA